MKKVFNISLEILVNNEQAQNFWGDERAKEQITQLLLDNLPEYCYLKIKIEVQNENN